MNGVDRSNSVWNYLEELDKSGIKRGPHGTYIHITPEMREAYQRIKKQRGSVFPGYAKGGEVVNKDDPYDNIRLKAKNFPRARRAKN